MISGSHTCTTALIGWLLCGVLDAWNSKSMNCSRAFSTEAYTGRGPRPLSQCHILRWHLRCQARRASWPMAL